MPDAVSPWLEPWESFYVIVGSSGAALTGLQFVVMALVADSPRRSTSAEIDAFGTPNVVHFCSVLLVSSVLSAPWRTLAGARVVLLAAALGGLAYAALVARRARRQTGYQPMLEDWLWYVVLPGAAYVGLGAAAALMERVPESALFGVGAAALLLLFIGIHNAWDTVTYIVLDRTTHRRRGERARRAATPAASGHDAPDGAA